MRRKFNIGFFFISFMFVTGFFLNPAYSEGVKRNMDLDSKVRSFLQNHKDQWADWNVPEVDGKVLYCLL